MSYIVTDGVWYKYDNLNINEFTEQSIKNIQPYLK